MRAYARRGAVLALLAVVLVANPLYVPYVTPEPPAGDGGTQYDVHAVDPGSPADSAVVYRTVGAERVLVVPEFADHDRAYRAPGPAADVLARALDGDSAAAATTDPAVAQTLYRAVGGHQFVAAEAGVDAAFYRVWLTAGDGGAVEVTAERVTRSTVLRAVLYADAERYESLFDRERAVVDEAVTAGHADAADLGALARDAVVRNDTAYVFEEAGHTDSLTPSTRDVAGFALSALSVPVFLAALACTALAYRRAG